MRYRIDGVLYEMVPPPKHLAAITSRVKVMSQMDIAGCRLPQDGRIEPTVRAPRSISACRSSPPCTARASSCVSSTAPTSSLLDRIGMRPDDLTLFRALINKPNGIVIVTGPTGSGKTTTLYAALMEPQRHRHEDPSPPRTRSNTTSTACASAR